MKIPIKYIVIKIKLVYKNLTKIIFKKNDQNIKHILFKNRFQDPKPKLINFNNCLKDRNRQILKIVLKTTSNQNNFKNRFKI